MKLITLFAFMLSIGMTIALPAIAAKPEFILICHIEQVKEIDKNGVNVIVDTVYVAKLLPAPAVKALLKSHDDYLILVDHNGNISACNELNNDNVNIDSILRLLVEANKNKNK